MAGKSTVALMLAKSAPVWYPCCMRKISTINEVIILPGVHPRPHEITAAEILADYFQRNAYFLPESVLNAADIRIGNIEWEIKSPLGNGKYTIQHQLQRALKQSRNIVFDARRTKTPSSKVLHELEKQCRQTKSIRRLLLITKNKKVLVIK